jgi:single-strand DNA-binding protein
MTDTITLTGLVATDPRNLTTAEGLPITSFRLASTHRRYDRAKQSWVDGDTNWYTVTAFRRLASNSSASLLKGQRVIVTGRLRLREWANGERKGMSIEVEAESLGHDLTWGTAQFQRNVVSTPTIASMPGGGGSEDNVEDSVTVDAAGWGVPGGEVPTEEFAETPF